MKLQDKHNEFAVKCYAKYMKTNDVVQALIEEFADEFPQPPPPPKLLDYEKEVEGIEYQCSKDEYVAEQLVEIKHRYFTLYDNKGYAKFKKDEQILIQDFEKDFDLNWREKRKERLNDLLHKHSLEEKDFYKKLSSELSNQIRRLNITHTQFPDKYRKLFNETRDEFFKCQGNQNLQNNENILNELGTIYAHVKNLIFQEEIPAEAIKQVNMAHKLLETITSHNQNDVQKQETNIDTQESERTENA